MKKYLLLFLAFFLFSGTVEAGGGIQRKRMGRDGTQGVDGAAGAAGVAGPASKCYGGLASSLISAGTDYATVEATNTVMGLLPYYVRAFDGSTTEYMRGSIVLDSNLKLASNATFYANVRAKTAAASKNVQLLFKSSATATGGETNYLAISTGADIVPLSANMHKWTLFSWPQTITNLGWAGNRMVDFAFGRGHDTAILTTTELSGDLYWKDWKICVDLQ